MRQRRTDDGALRLDQPKLCFQLDGPKGAPTGFYTYNQQDSNRWVVLWDGVVSSPNLV